MKLQNAVKGALAVAVVSLSLCLSTVTAQAAGTLKVTDSAKIRSTASTSSEPVGSTSKGAKLDVISSVEPGDGYTWYKVKVEGDKVGYIRGDLVSDVSGDISSEGGASTTTNNDSTTSTETTVSPSDMTAGTTKDSVNVRSSASTKAEAVAKAESGQVVSITGEATDSSGKKWYQINYNGITGFIRSDFIDATKPAEETEAPVEEAPVDEFVDEEFVDEEATEMEEAPEVVVSKDYEVVFEPDKEGVEKWFLHDNIKNTRQSLDNIFAIMEQNENKSTENKASDSVLRIVVIVLGVLLVIAIVVIAILGFKLKDSYDDWEDEDDDDDDDDDDEEDDYVAISRRQPVRPAKIDEDDDDDDDDIKIVSRKAKPKKVATPSQRATGGRDGWQSKNFLEIDDDMEFEFLDIDNK